MLQPTSLKDAGRYPVTVSVAVAAAAVTLYWWSGQEIEGLFMNGQVWANWQLWRAFSGVLPHVNVLHLAFNLYWWWVFGTFIERVYGHVKFAGIVALLALNSSLLEFAVAGGGVGLSGIGYGLWAMLWVLERRDARFAGTVDQRTNTTFVVWFILCVVLTIADAVPIGNVAHGAGAATGALLGLAIASNGRRKRAWLACLVGTTILGVLGSTLLWPWVNRSGYAEAEVERAGLEAMEQGKNAKAVRWLEIAARMKGAPARAWYNLGIAYQREKRYDEALKAYEHAARMPDATTAYQQTAREFSDYLRRQR